MGLLDIVRSTKDMMSVVDTDTLKTALGAGATGLAAGSTAGAAVVAPIAAQALLQEGVTDYFKSIGK